MLGPTPSGGRANPSARGGRGCHVSGGAGRRPAARAAGLEGPQSGERVWPAPGLPEAGRSCGAGGGARVIAAREGRGGHCQG